MLKLLKIERDKQGHISILDVFDAKTSKKYRMVNADQGNTETMVIQKVALKLVDGTKVIGKVNLGKYPRVSDLLAYGKSPIPVFDATTAGVQGKTVFINKDHVCSSWEV